MQERRQYVRSNGLILIDFKDTEISGKSSAFDVSGAGVRITIDQQLKVGSLVDLKIFLPGSTQPIKASGKVIWVEKCAQKSEAQFGQKKEYYYTGIGFTDIDQSSREKIARHVYTKYHKE